MNDVVLRTISPEEFRSHPLEFSSVFQTPEFALCLPRQNACPHILIAEHKNIVVASWVLFSCPRNHLFAPSNMIFKSVDIHLRSRQGPTFSRQLDQNGRAWIAKLFLSRIRELLEEIRPASIELGLPPALSDLDRKMWCEIAEQLQFVVKHNYTHLVHLPECSEQMWQQIKPDRRTKVRKARSVGAIIEEVSDLNGLARYYEIRRETILRNRTGPVPWNYFETLFNSLHERRMFRVFLCKVGDRVGAGQTLFSCGENIFLAGVSISTWAIRERIPANDFLQWEILSWAIQNKFKIVDFVGAEPASKGGKVSSINLFKSRWGTKVHPVMSLSFSLRNWRVWGERVSRPAIIAGRMRHLLDMKLWSYSRA